MFRRLAAAVLVMALMLAGQLACVRAAHATCGRMVRPAKSRCCDHASLRSNACCCRAQPRPGHALRATTGEQRVQTSAGAAFAVVTLPPDAHHADSLFRRSLWRDAGLAPPAALLAQHTRLLL